MSQTKPLTKKQWQERLKGFTAQIKQQADAIPNGWMTLKVEECKDTKAPAFELQLPRIPFERWMRNAYLHRRSEWENVCPSGLKMQMDNRNHSDWWMCTGIPIDYAYRRKPYNQNDLYGWEPGDPEYVEPDPKADEHLAIAKRINEAAWDYRFESTTNRTRNSIFLVSTRKKIEGIVLHVRTVEDIPAFVEEAQQWKKNFIPRPVIAVVPNCSIEFDAVIRHAGAIITQVGSAAAHLVKVAREDRVPVIMCPDAFKEYFHYERVKIENKTIRSTT